jgi:hypothetical protein
MKYLKSLLILGLFHFSLLRGQNIVPQKVAFQSVIRSSSGALIAKSPIGVRLSIIQGNQFGQSVYVETHSQNTNTNGLLTVFLGQGVSVYGKFDEIKWEKGPYFLKSEFDLTGSTNYTLNSTSELITVPYAFISQKADSSLISIKALNLSCKGCITIDHIDNQSIEKFLKDTSSLNEIQFLSISKDTIYLSKGGFIKLPKDLDIDSVNEIQTLTKRNDTIFLDRGKLIKLNDDSPTNELQQISRNKDTIFLSNGGFVKLIDNDTMNEIQNFRISHDTLRLTKSKQFVLLGNKEQDTLNNAIAQTGDAIFTGTYNTNATSVFPGMGNSIDLSCNIDLGGNTYIFGMQNNTPFGVVNFNSSSNSITLLKSINSSLKNYYLTLDQTISSDKIDTSFTWFNNGNIFVYKAKTDSYYTIPSSSSAAYGFFNRLTYSTSPATSQYQLMGFSKSKDTFNICFQKGDQSDFYYYIYKYIRSTDKLIPFDSIELTQFNGTKMTTASVRMNGNNYALIRGDFKPIGLATKFQLSVGILKDLSKKETKLIKLPPYPIANAIIATKTNFVFWNNGISYSVNKQTGLLKSYFDSKALNFLASNSFFVSSSLTKNIGNLISSNGKYYLIGYMLNLGTGNEYGYLYNIKLD